MAKNPDLELGKQMWLMLTETFHEVAAANGIATQQQFTSLWAGFMAASCGGMCATIGPDMAAALLDEVRKSMNQVARAHIKAVPK